MMNAFSQVSNHLVSMSREEIEKMFDNFIIIIGNHFVNEEFIMNKYYYEDQNLHRESHRGYLIHLKSLRDKVYHGATVEYIIEALSDFFVSWDHFHLSHADKRLCDFLNSLDLDDSWDSASSDQDQSKGESSNVVVSQIAVSQQQAGARHSLTRASASARGDIQDRVERHEGFKLLENWWNSLHQDDKKAFPLEFTRR